MTCSVVVTTFPPFSLRYVLSSYLGYPRINFHGQFRADSNTHNNEVCNYREGPVPEDRYFDWNSEGTNEFEFVNTKVTSVVNKAGLYTEDPSDDPVIGQSIIGNLEGPLAKLSDGTNRDPRLFTVFGMQFDIKWSPETEFPKKEDIAFHGLMAPYVVTQNVWRRIPCYFRENCGENPYQRTIRAGTQSVTTMDVELWGDLKESEALRELKGGYSDTKKLSVRVTLFYTTRRFLPYIPYNASLGYVVGTIGMHDTFPESPQPGRTYDAVNVPGKRGFVWLRNNERPKNLKFEGEDDICKGLSPEEIDRQQWVNFAPFEVTTQHYLDNFEIQLDLSNSIPADLHNSLRNLGVLQLAIIRSDCYELIGQALQYDSEDRLYKSGGIHIIPVESDLSNERLALVQVLDPWPEPYTSRCVPITYLRILLEEDEYLVRPLNYYSDRFEKGIKVQNKQIAYVT